MVYMNGHTIERCYKKRDILQVLSLRTKLMVLKQMLVTLLWTLEVVHTIMVTWVPMLK